MGRDDSLISLGCIERGKHPAGGADVKSYLIEAARIDGWRDGAAGD